MLSGRHRVSNLLGMLYSACIRKLGLPRPLSGALVVILVGFLVCITRTGHTSTLCFATHRKSSHGVKPKGAGCGTGRSANEGEIAMRPKLMQTIVAGTIVGLVLAVLPTNADPAKLSYRWD